MNPDYDIRPIDLGNDKNVVLLTGMLERNGLRFDPVDIYLGIYDCDDCLVGGGGLCGNVIKCVAVDPALRGESIANTLITNLRNTARYDGHRNIFVFTKPENETLFRSLAFYTIARSQEAVMLESDRRGVKAYTDYLASLRRPGVNGAIVMNCNPMTAGHIALIEKAAAEVDHLYVIAVKEEKSEFPYQLRHSMMVAGCGHLNNVTVCEGSDYAVSAATFPSYFLKNIDHSTDTSITLDIDIFTRHIAPALGVSVRYAGTEPADMLTRRYNELMKVQLPLHGIKFVEVERYCTGGSPISASSLRMALAAGDGERAVRMVAPGAQHIFLARLAARALERELALTPKPGLVDRNDNGAHRDMDYQLMQRSISCIEKGVAEILKNSDCRIRQIPDMETAIAAERAMFDTTCGINTHKGALFAISLVLLATRWLLEKGDTITTERLPSAIAGYAANVPGADNTHGSHVRKQYGVAGALESARAGYPALFNSWLPYYRSLEDDCARDAKTLLKIMSELDDTNVLHRAGQDGALYVKSEARRLLGQYSEEGMQTFNRECIKRNISPGGAADMLSLTFLIDLLTV